MSGRWVTLHEGSPGLILAEQAELEAHGIPTYIPSLNVKFADPTITGGNCFDWELQVPDSALAAARELLSGRAEAIREHPHAADEADGSDVRGGG
ncbi:MAG: hypothetical protein IT453_02350 [Planctomycetes bacterium]|nr:hypothetical protein [Planctomycetota bacterium]